MPLPLIPIVIAGLAGGAYYRHRKKRGMTPERKKIYEAGMTTLMDPNKIRKLSDVFEKEGLKKEAAALRKRALLRELPPEQRAQRKAVLKKALASKDPKAVLKVAEAFHGEGATGAALSLRKYAAGLKKAG